MQNTDTTIGHVVAEALLQERIEIARMLRAEAAKHSDAQEEAEADGDQDDEAWMHKELAEMLWRLADTIRARTSAEPVEPEPVF